MVSATIRRYEPRDEKAVLQLSQNYASWDSTSTAADIQSFHAREPDMFLVAEVEGRVVGFIFGRELREIPAEVLEKRKAKKCGYIDVMAVVEENRRKGIGTALLYELFRVFRKRGIDYVSLAVPAEAIAARNLYEKLGFQAKAYFLSKRL